MVRWLLVWDADGEIQPTALLGTAVMQMSWCFLLAQLQQQPKSMCWLLAPVPGSWPQCLLSHPLLAQRPANPAPRSHPTPCVFLELCIWPSRDPPVPLGTKWGPKLHEGLPHSGQFWLWAARAAAPQGRHCTAGCTSHWGQASVPNQMSLLFSLMRQTSLFSSHNMWFWLIFTGLCVTHLCCL